MRFSIRQLLKELRGYRQGVVVVDPGEVYVIPETGMELPTVLMIGDESLAVEIHKRPVAHDVANDTVTFEDGSAMQLAPLRENGAAPMAEAFKAAATMPDEEWEI